MNVKLAAVDMDGTLLTPMGHISTDTAKTIRRFQEAGSEFVICTGRNYQDAKAFVDEVQIRCSFICMSGAAIFDYEGNSLLKIILTPERTAEIMKIMNRHGLAVDLITNEGYFTTSSPEEKYQDYYQVMKSQFPDPSNIPADLAAKARERVKNIHFVKSPDEVQRQNIDIYKICADHLKPEFAASLKQEFKNYPQFDAASSFPTNIEITDSKARKGLALKYYAGLKKIPLEKVMAIGDSDNDLSMMTAEFGYTVAMGNAMDCVKQSARYQTRSNSEDGVAWAIKKLAFGECGEDLL